MPDPTELFLLRHEVTTWNKEHRFQGRKDIPLSETGKQNIKKYAPFFEKFNFNKIFSSPLTRAVQTAEPVAEVQGLKVITRENLVEIDFGKWEGLDYNEVKQKYPQIIKKWFENPGTVAIPGGEKIEDFKNRIRSVFDKIIDHHPGQKILVVTHGGVIKMWIALLMEMPAASINKISIDNGKLSRVCVFEDYPVLKYLNQSISCSKEG